MTGTPELDLSSDVADLLQALVDVPSEWNADVWTNLNDPDAWEAFVRDTTER